MLFDNPHARRSPDAFAPGGWSLAAAQARRAELAHWPLFRSGRTPLWPLPGLARHLGLARIDIKDESSRSPLGHVAALAWPMALAQQFMRLHPQAGWRAADLLAGRHARALKRLGVVTADTGPRGRVLAAAARSLGCRCRVVLPAQALPEDDAPWAEWGADTLRVAEGQTPAQVVQRQAVVPAWVGLDTPEPALMQDLVLGFSSLMDEVLTVRPPQRQGSLLQSPYTHVLVQADGADDALAAGVLCHLGACLGPERPRVMVVGPAQTDLPAWAQALDRSLNAPVLRLGVDHLMAVPRARTLAAMRLLAHSPWGDIPVLSGDTGALGLGALLALMAEPDRAAHLGLNAQASVLLLNTEGATDPGRYAAQVGRRAESVRLDQAAWQVGLLGLPGRTRGCETTWGGPGAVSSAAQSAHPAPP